MKILAAFVIVLALARSVTAQDAPAQTTTAPDYSRDKLIEIFANDPVVERAEPNMKFRLGAVEFKALNMRWRISYLPFLMPLSGSIPWRSNSAFGSLPDPFALTGTEIASPPRTWKQTRDMNSELKRIERTEKEKRAKVVANPD